LRINRIYDTLLPEENYKIVEEALLEIIHEIFEIKEINILPSDLLTKVGEKLNNRSLLAVAARNNIPIFVPAFSDSEFALNLIKYSIKEDYKFNFDILGDVLKFADIIRNSREYGTLIIGGGVPRNWAQQIFPLLDQIEKVERMGYNYSVRIHTATEYDGGLSGCTISESKSWGKYSLESKYISVWCDATIALPILITGLLQRLKII
jgi:deoxyhypusine synthase